MAKPIDELKARLKPELVQQSQRLAAQYLREDALAELRRLRGVRQEELAAVLGIRQPSLSTQEKRRDQRINTLARYIEALGGELEIYAAFPDGERILLGDR